MNDIPSGLRQTSMTQAEYMAMVQRGPKRPADPGPTRILEFAAYVNRLQFEGLLAYLESHAIRVDYRPVRTED